MVCSKYFQETLGTIFPPGGDVPYGSSVPAEDIMHGIALLCEGVSPRKVARVYKVDKDTVLRWLMEAAVHSEAVLGYMLHDLHLSEVQMDELYGKTVRSKRKMGIVKLPKKLRKRLSKKKAGRGFIRLWP